MIRITHRDEVEAPITDWLREAYEVHDVLAGRKPARKPIKTKRRTSPRKMKKARGPKRRLS